MSVIIAAFHLVAEWWQCNVSTSPACIVVFGSCMLEAACLVSFAAYCMFPTLYQCRTSLRSRGKPQLQSGIIEGIICPWSYRDTCFPSTWHTKTSTCWRIKKSRYFHVLSLSSTLILTGCDDVELGVCVMGKCVDGRQVWRWVMGWQKELLSTVVCG